jgi:hypothetical protein
VKLDELAKRVDALLTIAEGANVPNAAIAELLAGTVSVLTTLYGPASPQLRAFETNTTRTTMSLSEGYFATARSIARGALRNVRAELQAGLIGNLRGQLAGEVVADFVEFANEVLKDNSANATTLRLC